MLLSRLVYLFHGRLRATGNRNLLMAMPDLPADARKEILISVFDSLGRLLGEFSQFPKLRRDSVEEIVVYDGLENYLRAAEAGRGVLLLTGHFGAWELCAFAQGLYGHPLSFLVRPLDNPLLDRLITRYRELSGNRVIGKNRAVKPVLSALGSGADIGMLIDANTLIDEGTFCDFFGVSASTTTGLAVFALRSGSPVVPGFLIWDKDAGVHRLIFDPEVPTIRTGDFREEVRLNTAQYTKVIEEYARRYPEQWLWIHKRWKTRPDGQPDIYGYREAPQAVDPASRDVTA
jgi:KDO2-lipid IV(A) lauroyltransferase